MSLIRFILRRLLTVIPTLFVILVITFIMTRMLPGDPAMLRMHPRATYEDYLREVARLGLDQPIYVQFFVFLGDIFSGNWGNSYIVGRDYPIWLLISQKLPISLEIMAISMIFAIFLGIKLGKISGGHKNTKRDIIARIVTYIFVSIPAFVIVTFFMQLYVSTPLKILPIFGYKTMGYDEPAPITFSRILNCLLSGKIYLLTDYLWHLIIPVSGLTIVQLVMISRQLRASMISTLEEDYIRTAYAKGVKKRQIIKKHALRNSATPVIVVSGMGFSAVLGGMIALEVIYQLPGMGKLFYDAINGSDYNIIIASIWVFSIVVIIFNFISDILIAVLDPRIKLK
ncbi:MAG: ABC transporter permease [Promethearchaeota archaeon]